MHRRIFPGHTAYRGTDSDSPAGSAATLQKSCIKNLAASSNWLHPFSAALGPSPSRPIRVRDAARARAEASKMTLEIGRTVGWPRHFVEGILF